MAISSGIADEIQRLKEQSRKLEEELELQKEATARCHAQQEKVEEDTTKLRAKVADADAARASQLLADEQVRLDAEAQALAAATDEVESYRMKAAQLLSELRSTQASSSPRIKEELLQYQRASTSRVHQATLAWQSEQEVLRERLDNCEAELSSLRIECNDAKKDVSQLQRRTALLRLGRAAATHKHEVRMRNLEQKARREKAIMLRKLARQAEELEKEVALRKETLNKEVRRTEIIDKRSRDAGKDEIESLRDELEQLEDRIEAMEHRLRQNEVLSEAAEICPQLDEGDRVRRCAEAASFAGSVNFRNAANRLHWRALAPGSADGENVIHTQTGGRKLQGSASAPCLPQLRGGLQQLESQMQNIRGYRHS
jgi:hypothetical protein